MGKLKFPKIFYVSEVYGNKLETDEYHLRTVRGGYAFYIQKNAVTWGKRSKKNGDFGWLKSFPAYYRRKVYIRSEAPFLKVADDWKTTKLQSLLYLDKQITPDWLDFGEDKEPDDLTFDQAKTKIKAAITRERNSKK